MNGETDYKALAQLSRAHMAAVWARARQDNGPLNTEDQILADLMEMHPQYYGFWESIEQYGDRFFDPTCEDNPFLHVSLHVAVERQIRAGAPLLVLQTVQRLVARGDDPHDARHAVMAVLVRQLWDRTMQGRPFDVQRYAAELERL